MKRKKPKMTNNKGKAIFFFFYKNIILSRCFWFQICVGLCLDDESTRDTYMNANNQEVHVSQLEDGNLSFLLTPNQS